MTRQQRECFVEEATERINRKEEHLRTCTELWEYVYGKCEEMGISRAVMSELVFGDTTRSGAYVHNKLMPGIKFIMRISAVINEPVEKIIYK